jgi:hypothetical protein
MALTSARCRAANGKVTKKLLREALRGGRSLGHLKLQQGSQS